MDFRLHVGLFHGVPLYIYLNQPMRLLGISAQLASPAGSMSIKLPGCMSTGKLSRCSPVRRLSQACRDVQSVLGFRRSPLKDKRENAEFPHSQSLVRWKDPPEQDASGGIPSRGRQLGPEGLIKVRPTAWLWLCGSRTCSWLCFIGLAGFPAGFPAIGFSDATCKIHQNPISCFEGQGFKHHDA